MLVICINVTRHPGILSHCPRSGEAPNVRAVVGDVAWRISRRHSRAARRALLPTPNMLLPPTPPYLFVAYLPVPVTNKPSI